MNTPEDHSVLRVMNNGNIRGTVTVTNACVRHPDGTEDTSGAVVRLEPSRMYLEPHQTAGILAEVHTPAEGDYVFTCSIVDQDNEVVANVTMQLASSMPTFSVTPDSEVVFGTAMVGGMVTRAVTLESTSVWPINFSVALVPCSDPPKKNTSRTVRRSSHARAQAVAAAKEAASWFSVHSAMTGMVHGMRQQAVVVRFCPTRAIRRCEAILRITWGPHLDTIDRKLVGAADVLDLRWRVAPVSYALPPGRDDTRSGSVGGDAIGAQLGLQSASGRHIVPPGSPSVDPFARRVLGSREREAMPNNTYGTELYRGELAYTGTGLTRPSAWQAYAPLQAPSSSDDVEGGAGTDDDAGSEHVRALTNLEALDGVGIEFGVVKVRMLASVIPSLGCRLTGTLVSFVDPCVHMLCFGFLSSDWSRTLGVCPYRQPWCVGRFAACHIPRAIRRDSAPKRPWISTWLSAWLSAWLSLFVAR